MELTAEDMALMEEEDILEESEVGPEGRSSEKRIPVETKLEDSLNVDDIDLADISRDQVSF